MVYAERQRQQGSRLAPGNQQPVECVQGPGQVIYLPSGWKHLTLNIGEAIGVGGQAGQDTRTRYSDGIKALEQNPDDFFGHKSAGLGLLHQVG